MTQWPPIFHPVCHLWKICQCKICRLIKGLLKFARNNPQFTKSTKYLRLKGQALRVLKLLSDSHLGRGSSEVVLMKLLMAT